MGADLMLTVNSREVRIHCNNLNLQDKIIMLFDNRISTLTKYLKVRAEHRFFIKKSVK